MKNIFLLLFIQHGYTEELIFDKNIGLIKHKLDNNKAILVDGEQTINAVLKLQMPTFSVSGQCSLIHKGKIEFPEVAPNIQDSTHPEHKSEINKLGSLMTNQMQEHSMWLIKRLTDRLGISNGPFEPQSLDLLDRYGTAICNQDGYTCHFALSANVNQGCIDQIQQKHLHNYRHQTEVYQHDHFMAQKFTNTSTWSKGRCGLVSSENQNNSTFIKSNPSICCTLEESGDDCPKEARLLLKEYSETASHTTAPTLHEDQHHSYCVTPISITKSSTTVRNRRDGYDMYATSFKELPHVRYKTKSNKNFYIGISPVIYNWYVGIKRMWQMRKEEKQRLEQESQLMDKLLQSSSEFNKTSKNDTEMVSNLVDQIRVVNQRKTEMNKEQARLEKQARKLRELNRFLNSHNSSDPVFKQQLDEIVQDLVEISTTETTNPRHRRSISGKFAHWAEYMLDGAFLTNTYDERKIDFNNQSIKQVQKILNEQGNKLLNMGHIISETTRDVNDIMCQAKMVDWKQRLMVRESLVSDKLQTEILDIIGQCTDDQIPYLTDLNALKLTCKSQTPGSLHHICDRHISKLFRCSVRNIYLEGQNINFHMEFKLQLPSFETGLYAMNLKFIPVLPSNLKTLGTFGDNTSKEVVNKRAKKLDKINNIEHLETINKLLEVLQSRERRSVDLIKPLLQDNKIYTYVTLNIPSLSIFYAINNNATFIAFDKCENNQDLMMCYLGQDEYWEHSECLTAILDSNDDLIRKRCPIKLHSSGQCHVEKYKEYTFLTTFRPVTITVENQKQRQLFKQNFNQCDDVCLIQPQVEEKSFVCDGKIYSIKSNKTIELINEVKTIKNINGKIDPNRWTYDLIDSKHSKSVKLNDQLVYISPELHENLQKTGIIMIVAVTTIVAVTIVYHSVKRCWPSAIIRKCLKRKRGQNQLKKNHHIILSKKRSEFSDDSAYSEEEEDFKRQNIVF